MSAPHGTSAAARESLVPDCYEIGISPEQAIKRLRQMAQLAEQAAAQLEADLAVNASERCYWSLRSLAGQHADSLIMHMGVCEAIAYRVRVDLGIWAEEENVERYRTWWKEVFEPVPKEG